MIQDQLRKLGLKHDKWVALVRNMGCNEAYIEDVVQDAYLKIHGYLEKGTDIYYGNDDVNDFYMYMTLRSIYLNGIKRKTVANEKFDSSEEVVDLFINNLRQEWYDSEEADAFELLVNKIFKEINSWDFYSRNIFIAYFTTGMSLDKLSFETNIGRSSLYNSIRHYRQIIKEMFSEDAEDYYNGDYDKI